MSSLPAVMRAARAAAPGGPDNLNIELVDLPELRPDDALVEVHAAAITPTELTWVPTWTNADGSSRAPTIPSHEVAGVVVALGQRATGMPVGTPVLALTDFYRNGAAAEYVAVRAADLAPWPEALDAPSAAALPLAGLTAWQGLFEHGQLEAHERVLVLGATGGVGTLAVQLARWRGARVIAPAKETDAAALTALGVDEVLPRRADGTIEGLSAPVDLVFDAVGGTVLARALDALGANGRVVSIVSTERDIAQHEPRAQFFIVESNREQLDRLTELAANGTIHVVVDRVLPLDEIRAAFEAGPSGGVRGKIVLDVGREADQSRS